MRKIAALLLASGLLVSCVGIDSKLTINDNGSGTLVLTYRISQLVIDLGVSTSTRGAVPLPISKEDFDRSLVNAKGKVRLTKFQRTENEQDVTIAAELSFDSVEALAQVDAFQDAQLKLAVDGSRKTFTEVIARAPAEPVSEDSLRMVDALFNGYGLTFIIQAPKAIQSLTLGTLAADKRVLSYSASIQEIMKTRGDIVLSVSW